MIVARYDPHKHHRRSIRLKGYDYSSAGYYFVTICVRGGVCSMGDIVDGDMIYSDYGRIAMKSWLWLADRYDHVELDEWTVMPNHLHGILVIVDDDALGGSGRGASGRGASRSAPTVGRKPLGRLVGAFKTVSSKKINDLRGRPGAPFWQRDFWDHIIRNERALKAIREYIQNNPACWEADKLHPAAGINPFNKSWKRPQKK
jgi:REP element-mobilizing transposase RayT